MSRAECVLVDAGWTTLEIYRFGLELDAGTLEEAASRAEYPLVIAAYRLDEDPGYCSIAVSYLYVDEERRSGAARIRNPGLHLKMVSLGLSQIGELRFHDKYEVLYLVAPRSRSPQISDLLPGLSPPGECHAISCHPGDLEKVSLPRARSLRF